VSRRDGRDLRERPGGKTERRFEEAGALVGREARMRPGAVATERRAASDRQPRIPRGTLALAMAAQRFLEHLDATPGVPVPATLRARVAASWPLHAMDTKRSKGS
jgi:hypothetical protein